MCPSVFFTLITVADGRSGMDIGHSLEEIHHKLKFLLLAGKPLKKHDFGNQTVLSTGPLISMTLGCFTLLSPSLFISKREILLFFS